MDGDYFVSLTFTATRTFWRKHAMIIIDTINLIVDVHREGYAIQTFITHATPEASWVIGFSHRLKYLQSYITRSMMHSYRSSYITMNGHRAFITYHLHDQMSTYCTFLSRLLESRVLQMRINARENRNCKQKLPYVLNECLPCSLPHSKHAHARCRTLYHAGRVRRSNR